MPADLIDEAIQAYRNKTPDSIAVFRSLNEEQAETVTRILRMTARPRVTTKAEPPKSIEAGRVQTTMMPPEVPDAVR